MPTHWIWTIGISNARLVYRMIASAFHHSQFNGSISFEWNAVFTLLQTDGEKAMLDHKDHPSVNNRFCPFHLKALWNDSQHAAAFRKKNKILQLSWLRWENNSLSQHTSLSIHKSLSPASGIAQREEKNKLCWVALSCCSHATSHQ